MRLSHLALAVLVCFAWGLNAVAAKIGVTYIPPVFFTALRFIAVLVCLFPWLKPVPGRYDVLIPAVFFMGGLHFALIFAGVKFSDASTMAIVNQIYVPISVLLAMFWLGETVPLRRWLGIALAFTGVVVFSLNANAGSHLTGIFLLVADAFSMAAPFCCAVSRGLHPLSSRRGRRCSAFRSCC
jgi:O-acetylserine/cysteine efflux transporter